MVTDSTDHTQPDDDNVPWRIQGAVYGMGMFCTSVYYMMVVVVPVFVVSLDLSYFLAGIILGCRPILSLVFSIHAGALMDRIGSRRVMVFFGVLGVIAPLMYPMAPWIGWLGLLVIAQMFAGLADSMGWLGAQTLIGQHMKGRTKYSGRLSATIRIGHAIAPITVGYAWDQMGVWAAFGLMSLWNLGFLGCALALPTTVKSNQPKYFLGQSNILVGKINNQAGINYAEIASGQSLAFVNRFEHIQDKTKVIICIRPEKIQIEPKNKENPDKVNIVTGTVVNSAYSGNSIRYVIEIDKKTRITVDQQLMRSIDNSDVAQFGDKVDCLIPPDAISVFFE